MIHGILTYPRPLRVWRCILQRWVSHSLVPVENWRADTCLGGKVPAMRLQNVDNMPLKAISSVL